MNLESWTEIEIQTPFRTLAAKRWGPDGGIPVIGLHGWLDNANTFDGIAPLLPQLQLVALDLPGHGRSEHRPPGMPYHYSDYVDDVIAAADTLGWERFLMLGHSMGGGVAVFTAGAFPERVRGLLLIEGLGAVSGEMDDGPQRMRHAVLEHQRKGDKAPSRPRSFQTLVRARAQAGHIGTSSAETLVRRSAAQNGQGAWWQSDPRLDIPAAYPFSEDYVRPFLKRIDAPVLLILAEEGLLRKRPYFRSRPELIRHLKTVWLPGNHHLHLDTPRPVAKVIAEFLVNEYF